ncbi:isoleucine--tRNA ligase [Wolbachia endosymbiont of Howardula sp.]|uniref:isoleucine--tRNA ligase n=1 Tax=Wolbachia endosymbiont of Howardula sp. TaxID=2916816 RepID=UPI00217D4688|nr:isoleucine--tRNA ligase [Wolbachia endosymbiont of Howardula sp.]UWI83057.1 isoleucine--tRNA ligase [Wolbachia endosymbiont of Howardula sp.]
MDAKLPHYPKTTSNPNFTLLEQKIIIFWQSNKIFEHSVEQYSKNHSFVCYDGPPFANGLPHYGHLLTGFIKDTIARYHTMMQKRVERKFGWDCHGLPAEISAEKELGISGRINIEAFGIAQFNSYCRNSVMKFTSKWKEYIVRQARWVDFENDYKTMDRSFMESVMWAFKTLYEKGLVYQSVRVVPYSWSCETILSNFETRIDNAYREKTSQAVTVAFELLESPKELRNTHKKCKLLAWTTTPWTLPSNLALAIGQDIEYSAVSIHNEIYIFSKNFLKKCLNHCEEHNLPYQEYNIEIHYKSLIGLAYKPIFEYFKDTKNAFRTIIAEYVTETDGTGIVHLAPGFGEEDFSLCQHYNIQPICPIDQSGKFTHEVSDLSGVHVFDANNTIISILHTKGHLFSTESYIHNYPHCWRTDTPLIYRTMNSWYIAVTKLKKRMIELNKTVNWIPDHIREGQFEKWLEGAHDWSISRNRFWGTPIPVWQSDDDQYPRIDVYGSIAELEKDFNTKIEDLHRPFIDLLTRPNPNDPTGQSSMRRVPDIFDCWFESGAMPFAHVHYPFNNKEWFENNFPADSVTEYTSQTRGWFYTLFVLATALFDTVPFKNCLCHGVVLDIKGQKLSKRLNNYEDPIEIFNTYGSDALRFLMLSSSIVSGGNLMLDKAEISIRNIIKNVIQPIWNSYHFFTIYANIDGIQAQICTKDFSHLMDRYILFKCFETIKSIQIAMNHYHLQEACLHLINFFEVLNNWYIRRTRRRFWNSELNQDKIDAYNVLYTLFYYILKASAPLLPLTTEVIWQGLQYQELSVHLATFPNVEQYNNIIITKMDLVREICNAILSIRNIFNIRIRQPLKNVNLYHQSLFNNLENEFLEIIKDEVNIQAVNIVSELQEIASEELHLNFSVLGKRIPNQIKQLIQYVKHGKWKRMTNIDPQFTSSIINNMTKSALQHAIFLGDEMNYCILQEGEYEIVLKANSNFSSVFDRNKGVVVLDTTLNDELILEGIARDVIRCIQDSRKQAHLCISDRIHIIIHTNNEKIQESVCKWLEYIQSQTLALSLKINSHVASHWYSYKYRDMIVNIYTV